MLVSSSSLIVSTSKWWVGLAAQDCVMLGKVLLSSSHGKKIRYNCVLWNFLLFRSSTSVLPWVSSLSSFTFFLFLFRWLIFWPALMIPVLAAYCVIMGVSWFLLYCQWLPWRFISLFLFLIINFTLLYLNLPFLSFFSLLPSSLLPRSPGCLQPYL